VDEHGRPIVDDSFLLLFNAHHESIDWLIPRAYGQAWSLVLDTSNLRPEPEPKPVTRRVTSQARSILVFRS
jgi:glycogen operon protein